MCWGIDFSWYEGRPPLPDKRRPCHKPGSANPFGHVIERFRQNAVRLKMTAGFSAAVPGASCARRPAGVVRRHSAPPSFLKLPRRSKSTAPEVRAAFLAENRGYPSDARAQYGTALTEHDTDAGRQVPRIETIDEPTVEPSKEPSKRNALQRRPLVSRFQGSRGSPAQHTRRPGAMANIGHPFGRPDRGISSGPRQSPGLTASASGTRPASEVQDRGKRRKKRQAYWVAGVCFENGRFRHSRAPPRWVTAACGFWVA